MDVISTLKAVFALTIVVGLILGLAYLLRRFAPALMAKMQAQRGARRLQVVETLVLDPARRLVLVRLDDQERLILLGEGRELDAPSALHTKTLERSISPTKAPLDPNDDLF
jgi:flagellar protein FliO/FliZ